MAREDILYIVRNKFSFRFKLIYGSTLNKADTFFTFVNALKDFLQRQKWKTKIKSVNNFLP